MVSRTYRGIVSVLAIVAVLVLLIHLGREAVTRAASPEPVPVELTVDPRVTGVTVPRSFLGASTEYWALPGFEGHLALAERALSLLRVSGEGPLVLRIGGASADEVRWDPFSTAVPRWLFALTPRWVRDAGTLVHDLGARLILDLNIFTNSPSGAEQWARVVQTRLPTGSIAGFEVGNEPDIYQRQQWPEATGALASILPGEITPRSYTHEFLAYARALSRVAPGVPILGPALANPHPDADWIASLIAGARRKLGAVSAHLYPLSACLPPSSPYYPTIPRVLGENASAALAYQVRAGVELARRAGVPFRLTELNSVTCGGRPGVSNTFATALWAPDALFELLRAGVGSADIHIRLRTINAAFVIHGDRLEARPLLYGLALFARTLGPRARLVPLQLHGPQGLNLKAWAVRLAGGWLHVLIIDKDAHPALVDLRLPGTGPATIERLLAPSVNARCGVTLDGQSLVADGRWRGRRATETIAAHADAYTLTIPAYSAAMVSVRIPPRLASPVRSPVVRALHGLRGRQRHRIGAAAANKNDIALRTRRESSRRMSPF